MITTPLNKKKTIIHENTNAKLTSQLSFAKNVATMSVKYFLVIVITIAVMFEFIDHCKGQYECIFHSWEKCKKVSLVSQWLRPKHFASNTPSVTAM